MILLLHTKFRVNRTIKSLLCFWRTIIGDVQ